MQSKDKNISRNIFKKILTKENLILAVLFEPTPNRRSKNQNRGTQIQILKGRSGSAGSAIQSCRSSILYTVLKIYLQIYLRIISKLYL